MIKAGRIEKCISRFITAILLVLTLVISCPSFSFNSEAAASSNIVNVRLGKFTYKNVTLKVNTGISFTAYFKLYFELDPGTSTSVNLSFTGDYVTVPSQTNYGYYFSNPRLETARFTSLPYTVSSGSSASNSSDEFFIVLSNPFNYRQKTEVMCYVDVDFRFTTISRFTSTAEILGNDVYISDLTFSFNPGITLSLNNFYTADYTQLTFNEDNIYNTSVYTKEIAETLKGIDISDISSSVNQQTEEIKAQTDELKKQTEEQKKQTDALTNYDNADKMDSESSNLGNTIGEYDKTESSLFESANINISNFDITTAFDFKAQLLTSIGFLSTIMTELIFSMGDFSLIYTVGICMIVIGMLLGLWKFAASSGGDSS